MFSREQLSREPEIAKVNETNCAACFACVRTCPYTAIDKAEIRDRKGNLVKRTARVNQGLCMGCGTCVAICPSKSIDLEGWWHDPHALRVLHWEYAKYLAAMVLTTTGLESNRLDRSPQHGESRSRDPSDDGRLLG